MITEQQVREVFALIASVRDRWMKDFREYNSSFVRLEGDYLSFIDGSSGEEDWQNMPLATLFDYDAVAGPRIEENRRLTKERQEQDKVWRRNQYERLRKEFGEA